MAVLERFGIEWDETPDRFMYEGDLSAMIHPDVLGLILGGGRGTRLWPLTKLRAKPAVPIGGKYRLVDIPLSNCLNSGIQRIAVLTQFNSVSLHRHISQTYHFDFFHSGWVQILAAEQTVSSEDWYQGTADAVRKQMFEIEVADPCDVLILAGDHLYRMDFSNLIEAHRSLKADVTVVVKPVSKTDASRFGILKMAGDHSVTAFTEKPKDPAVMKEYASRDDPGLPFWGSMGIYLIQTHVLRDLLESDLDDFGGDVIPAAIDTHRVFGFPFDDYWEDIGTIRSFYHANLALAQPNPAFNFHDPNHPIYTHPRFLPGSRIYDVRLDCVKLADGCIVEGAEIQNSVIGIRSVIGDDVLIRDTVMMGADYYEEESKYKALDAPPLGIGKGSRIHGAIIDKNACVGENVVIEPFPPGTEIDEGDWFVRDGVVVIPKHGVIPDGTHIGA
ncbi:MAG: glucose-1-phosphate adenylyltransferase [Anaerolineales bacterium]